MKRILMSSQGSAKITVHPAFVVGTVDHRLFGSFVEHLGRGVYGGVFDPDDAGSSAEGFREDVLALVRELGVSTVRYPGGNFVSAYDWRDGVGPASERPVRLDPAWHSVETNRFGTDEFLSWCRRAEVEPMLAVNLGTNGIRSALQLQEYVNHPSGTTLADLRKANGHPEPWAVRMWCLGNEMDGPWQIGHMPAREYGRLAAATGSAMRAIDPDLCLVACGSSNDRMETFGTWEREVLEECWEVIDHISCHQYARYDGDLARFLASGVTMDHFIATVAATIAHVGAVRRSKREVTISFDEWNVWDYTAHDARVAQGLGWDVAPRLLEDVYSVADAVVVGDMLISMINRADVVRAASMAQLVNVIGPIMAEPGKPAWRQTTFFPFRDAAASAGGEALRVAIQAPETEAEAPAISAAVVQHTDGTLQIMLVGRHTATAIDLELDLTSFGPVAGAAGTVLSDPDPFATNDASTPERVRPHSLPVDILGTGVRVQIPPVSWSVITVTFS
ncbi:alpha-L-arabinofuranosidase [Curtobacterium flaccumfaciens]|nr:alpha-L-arabinofuranosidase [Curtobacterium flaccumfaciens]